ncbi:MAG: hypothetical protein N2Z22_11885 [Turneriella sp.]|nr:hypothetical protein [Turneriella sp.]
MRYLKSAMPVPGKGIAYMLYEIEGENTIVRMLTHIPETGEIKLYPKPKVRTLFDPQRLEETTQAEFEAIWQKGEQNP